MKNQYSIFLCLRGCRLLFVTLKKTGKIFGSRDVGSMCAIFSRSARGLGGVSGCDKKGKIVLQSNTLNKPQIGISNSLATGDAQGEGKCSSKVFPATTPQSVCVSQKAQWIFTDLWVWIGLDDVNDHLKPLTAHTRSPFTSSLRSWSSSSKG